MGTGKWGADRWINKQPNKRVGKLTHGGSRSNNNRRRRNLVITDILYKGESFPAGSIQFDEATVTVVLERDCSSGSVKESV